MPYERQIYWKGGERSPKQEEQQQLECVTNRQSPVWWPPGR